LSSEEKPPKCILLRVLITRQQESAFLAGKANENELTEAMRLPDLNLN
jgi:hypothetical protein